ncbi:phosphonate ABC transporter, permease protein PhnE [Pseudomonas sp. PA15(2017)]|uniref:phosphonate ABC transporter, permease protein PhnE n=1 Tax=Pseudomonas sp. PA15(2017) TaxID=1932111 RepID=UPI0009615F26|nr:phosphonate ABC transporter, permease protein PhnE [Pseudomonas sp. PA15(2017)]OLU32449.1 phosphonate ABC transporter, permease protein PhnE [Pseudomonas sp. PA15(2017)]
MPIIHAETAEPQWRRRTTAQQWAHWLAWFAGALLFVWCARFISENTLWEFVADAGTQGASLLARMVPPQWDYTPELLKPLWDTLNIATLGTALGVVLAFPLALLAARNTTPSPVVRSAALLIIVSSRSINSLIWAMLLVAMLGPGVLAGIIAIALRSVGFVGKLLYEAVEEISTSPVEAIGATGAGRLQVLQFGVVPQIMPAFVGTSLYRWDINIREATVLGLVGAGGIGLQLDAAINNLAWDRVSVIFLLIFVTVIFSEWASAKLRQRLS